MAMRAQLVSHSGENGMTAIGHLKLTASVSIPIDPIQLDL